MTGPVEVKVAPATVESPERQEFRRLASSLGLSSVHISSEQPAGTLRFFVGGSVVKLKGDPGFGGFLGPRGLVRGFTKASRKRMLRFLQSVDRDAVGMPLFVTLTYPGEWPGDAVRWKRDLETWLHRLRRAHPDAWAVWRLEPQKRGAPHYHLLVFKLDALPREWLSRTWFEVVGSGDERHLRAGTQIQRVKSWRRVIRYAAKYLAKDVGELPEGWRAGVGRWWGVHNRKCARREALQIDLQGKEFYRVRRVLRRLVGGPGKSGRDWFQDDRGWFGWQRMGTGAFAMAETVARLVAWVKET